MYVYFFIYSDIDIGVVYNSMIYEWYMYIFWISLVVRRDIYRCIRSIFYILYLYNICTHLIQVCSVDLISYSIKSQHPRVFVCFVFLLFFFSRDNQRKESSWKSEKEWKGNVSWHQPAVFNHWTNRRTAPAVWVSIDTFGKKNWFDRNNSIQNPVFDDWASLIREWKEDQTQRKKAGWRPISLPSTNMTIFQEEIP